jgi:hypothetical protein
LRASRQHRYVVPQGSEQIVTCGGCGKVMSPRSARWGLQEFDIL